MVLPSRVGWQGARCGFFQGSFGWGHRVAPLSANKNLKEEAKNRRAPCQKVNKLFSEAFTLHNRKIMAEGVSDAFCHKGQSCAVQHSRNGEVYELSQDQVQRKIRETSGEPRQTKRQGPIYGLLGRNNMKGQRSEKDKSRQNEQGRIFQKGVPYATPTSTRRGHCEAKQGIVSKGVLLEQSPKPKFWLLLEREDRNNPDKHADVQGNRRTRRSNMACSRY